jgi:hypothetical protein
MADIRPQSLAAIIPENLFMTTITTPPHVDKETNPWESQRARFDLAAQKLNLDEGLWRVLRYPNREVTVYIPVQMDDGHLEVFTGFRAAFNRAWSGQGRHSLRTGCHTG